MNSMPDRPQKLTWSELPRRRTPIKSRGLFSLQEVSHDPADSPFGRNRTELELGGWLGDYKSRRTTRHGNPDTWITPSEPKSERKVSSLGRGANSHRVAMYVGRHRLL